YKRQFSQILLVSGVTNLIIIYPLIIMYSANGAAISLLVTELFVTAQMYLFLRAKKIYLIK
ncbi:flippase, partial [Escherichia coli]|nr:flippase [Escherichia coli]